MAALDGGTVTVSLDLSTSTDGGTRSVQLDAHLMILDTTLSQAPTAVTAVVDGGWPNDDVEFDIDGTVVLASTLDSVGGLGATSMMVSEANGAAGTHTLRMTSMTAAPGYQTTATFTVERDPSAAPATVGSDALAAEVAGTSTPSGVYRWALQDVMPGGLGNYIFPNNPTAMSSPHFKKMLSQTHTTSVSEGQYHISEVGDFAVEWQFSGFCGTQEFHDKLLAFRDVKRRFYLIDHRNRAWKVTFTDVDMVARKRSNVNGVMTDWAHDYTVSALIYDQNWQVPQ